MKLSFLKYRTSLLLKKATRTRNSVPYQQSRTAGVIFTVEDKQKHFAVKEFIKKLEADGKHVQVLEFLPENTENFEFKFDFFQEKDITFWGNIQSASAIQFAQAPFDFLYYVDTVPNPLILHLLARSQAKCRVGGHWDGSERYLDLMCHVAPNTTMLLDTIFKVVTNIR